MFQARNANGNETLNFSWQTIDSGRCDRLGKYCEPSKAVRKRKVIDRPSTKVARLEEKLDGLLTLLGPRASVANGEITSASSVVNQNQLTPISLDSPAEVPTAGENHENPSNSPDRVCDPGPDSRRGKHVAFPSDDSEISYIATGTKSTLYYSVKPNEFEPSEEEAEESLRLYKMSTMPFFPITIISTTMSAKELRQERPFLWLCIMAITSKSTERQKALNREMRLTLGRESLLEGKHNLDLLLGLITHVAW